VSFGPEHTFSSALLIDDSPGMIRSFESFGGYAYRYKGDEAFQEWLEYTGLVKEPRNNATHTDGALTR
jgi:hypothetical protein